jgi:hypothetical protein
MNSSAVAWRKSIGQRLARLSDPVQGVGRVLVLDLLPLLAHRAGQRVVADRQLHRAAVAGGDRAVERGDRVQEGPELDALGRDDRLGDGDADPGLRAIAQEAGAADVQAVVQDGLDVADQPLVVVVDLVPALEDAQDGAGVVG